MLAYVLALMVGLGSVSLYLAAFFFPEVYRRDDLPWSGVGLFYALVLWVCADRITGGLLLGETASVALIGWLAWQTLTLRRQTTPIEQQTVLPDTTALTGTVAETLTSVPAQLKAQLAKLTPATPAIAPEYVPLTRADFGPTGRQAVEAATQQQRATAERAARRAVRSSATTEPARELQPPRSQKSPPIANPRPHPISPSPVQPADSKPVYVRKRFRKATAEQSGTAPVQSQQNQSQQNQSQPLSDQQKQASQVDASNAAFQENLAEIVGSPNVAADVVVDSVESADAVIQAEIVHEAELTDSTPEYELRADYELKPVASQQRSSRIAPATQPQTDIDESAYETYE
jgi:hypothetical protein